MSVVSALFWHATGTLRAQLGEETLMPTISKRGGSLGAKMIP
jgi:hypothetical protein